MGKKCEETLTLTLFSAVFDLNNECIELWAQFHQLAESPSLANNVHNLSFISLRVSTLVLPSYGRGLRANRAKKRPRLSTT